MAGVSRSQKRETISVDGIAIDVLRVAELFTQVQSLIHDVERRLVTYVNVHTLNVARQNDCLRQAYARSALTYCDGAGVVLGAKLLGLHLPERMTAATFIYDFCRQWEVDGTRLFFLGGKPGVATGAAQALKRSFPRLAIVGTHDGFFQHHHNEEDQVIRQIEVAAPDILFVGFGTPAQEHWILRNWDRLHCQVVWPIGALVDYVYGEVSRAPKWMQDHCLEWLFRLANEPRRMFGRYVVGNSAFVFRVISQRRSQK